MLDLGPWGWYRFRGTWGFLKVWNKIELYRFRDTLQCKVVWSLPLWVINWAVVRAAVMAMGQDKSPSSLTYRDLWRATNPHKRLQTEDPYEEED